MLHAYGQPAQELLPTDIALHTRQESVCSRARSPSTGCHMQCSFLLRIRSCHHALAVGSPCQKENIEVLNGKCELVALGYSVEQWQLLLQSPDTHHYRQQPD